MRLRRILRTAPAAAWLLLILGGVSAIGQQWDVPARMAGSVATATGGKLTISGEARGRYERRTGQSFGHDPDVDTILYRHSLSMRYKPAPWLAISGMVRDSRAPGYGPNAPNSVRDEADLQEGYVELFPARKQGFGMTAGRMALAYGESRLIGTSRWANVGRAFDHARVYWRFAKARIDFLVASPVKIRLGEFNRPVLGERVWGAYGSLPDVAGKNLLEVYALRREQNRPGGFTGGSKQAGTDHLQVNTFGARAAGPLPHGLKYMTEGAVQTGTVGPARHRATGWVGSVTRRWMIGKRSLDALGEYKYASGTKDPRDASRDGAFDQLYPTNHDKFGHMDLLGWRNIHNVRSLATLGVTKAVALNVMYNSWWLASVRDGLYNSSGRSVARSADGTAGRHVGQEADVFGTVKIGRFTFGAGYGYVFKGEFIRKATPGVAPSYAYIFHTYAF